MEIIKLIQDFVTKYQILINNFFGILGLIIAFVVISFVIRLGIGIYKKDKGAAHH